MTDKPPSIIDYAASVMDQQRREMAIVEEAKARYDAAKERHDAIYAEIPSRKDIQTFILGNETTLTVKAFSGSIQVGDILTIKGSATDDRTWWQRHAPLWLGGRFDPTKDRLMTITGQVVGSIE